MIFPKYGDGQTPVIRTGPRSSAGALVALPVYNECRYVDDVLQAVHRYAQDILVVNDGSSDGTHAVLERHPYLHLITHDVKAGYGRSLIDAFDYARTHQFPWIITMDCDHQHQPACIPRFYQEIARADADIVSGSRYLQSLNLGSAPPPPERVAMNREIADLLNRALGTQLTDAFCGFKAYRTAAVSGLGLTETGYAFPLQLWVRAQRHGLRIREIAVPLIYHDPKRNFCPGLEDLHTRRMYYLRVLSRELGYDVTDATVQSTPQHGKRRPLCSS